MLPIDELYRKHKSDVFHFLVYLGVKKEEAEDLVQEVFMRVIKTHCSFRGNSSEKTWLYTIAKNIAVDHFRKQKKTSKNDRIDSEKPLEIKDEHALPEQITLQRDELYGILQVLKNCTPNQTKVIFYRFIYELSISETAEQLGWTESKVKITQHRALKILRSNLKQRNYEEVFLTHS